MISGNYDGDTAGCGSYDAWVVGEDVPKGPISNSQYSIGGSGIVYNTNVPPSIFFAGSSTPYLADTFLDGIITSIETKNIDTKLDDGVANTGQILGMKTRLMWGNAAYDDYCTQGSGHL
jgi:hypothetical protein